MDLEQALAELSTAHSVALRLHAAGAEDQLIAAALAIPLEGVRTLLEVAEAKLAVLLLGDEIAGVHHEVS